MHRGRLGTMAIVLLATTLSLGCGRWGFEPADSDGAVSPDTGTTPDTVTGVDAAALACASGPFGTPERVTGLGLNPSIYGPSPLADASGLYLSQLSGSFSTEDIYFARRIAGANFEPAEPVTTVNSSHQDGTPFIAPSGLELFFSSSRPDSDDRDLWLASRASLAEPWLVDRRLSELSSSGLDHTPSLTGDGLTLVFGSTRNSTNSENIYLARRDSVGAPFGAPTRIDELNTSDFETSTFIRPDGLELYFISNRPGGEGCDDIWVASRASSADPFDQPLPLTEINSGACEDDPALSADGCELWFASNRGGNGYELYRATR